MRQRKQAQATKVLRLAQALVLECDQTTRRFHHPPTDLQPRLLYLIPHHYAVRITKTLECNINSAY